MEFRAFKTLNIDGNFKVKKLMKMDLTKKIKFFIKIILIQKNILIEQKDKQGEDYDFAIYKPTKKN